MDLQEALTQISEIRRQVARTETFRGYRAAPIAFSGIIAGLTAACQYRMLPDPTQSPESYLLLWSGAAFLNLAVFGVMLALHYWQATSTLTRTGTLLAISQFAPCIVAGAILTCVIYRHIPASIWMLPGLWQILFSLGIFASFKLLPRTTFWVGVYYLITGSLCLMLAQDEFMLSPLAMGIPFSLGQLMTAGILYWALERSHEQ